MSKKLIKKISLFAAVFLFAGIGITAASSRIDFGEEEILLPENEIVDGDYLGVAGSVDATGIVNGDVMVAGGILNISGKSSGDVLAAGGEIKISGEKEGSVRAVGGNVYLAGSVSKNVTIAGGSLAVEKDSVIGGNLYAAGGNIEIRGNIKGDMKAAGGRVLLAGNVEKDAEIWVDKADKIIIRPDALINGNLIYHSDKEISFDKNVVGGEIIRKPISVSYKKDKSDFPGFLFGFEILGFLGLLILGLILYKLFYESGKTVFESLEKDLWRNLAFGIIAIILIPAFLIILAISLVGWPLMIIMLFMFIIAMMISKIAAAIMLGHLINKRFKQDEFTGKFPLMDFILGYLVLTVLWMIPVLGWLAACLINLWAFGGIVSHVYKTKHELN